MEQTPTLVGELGIRVVWTLGTECRQPSSTIPAHLVGLDEDHQAFRCQSRHMLDSRPLKTAEEGIVDAVGLDSVEPDSTGRKARIRQHSPTGEEQKTVLHQKRCSVVARMEGDAAKLRAIQTYRVEAGPWGRSRFVQDSVLALEEDGVPGLRRSDGVERRKVDGSAGVERLMGDLTRLGSVGMHLPDVPGIPGLPLGGKENALAVEGDIWIASTRKIAGQAPGSSVGLEHHE